MISLTIHTTYYGIHWRDDADEPVRIGADSYTREFRNLVSAAEYLADEGFLNPSQSAPCTADAWLSTGPDATPGGETTVRTAHPLDVPGAAWAALVNLLAHMD